MPFIVDKNIRKTCIDNLKRYDKKIYFSSDCDNVYFPVNTHPDIQIHFVNKNIAYVPPELYNYYKAILPPNIELHKGNKSLGSTYPDDVAYNISRIRQYVILNVKYADEKIVEYYKNHGFNFINVNQGYTKCNICTDGVSVVTEDEGIYDMLRRYDFDVLKIPCGEVALSGFPYGFIGGASGFYKNKIFLCGNIKNRELLKTISNFFAKNGTEIISLDEEILTDYGSIIYFE